MAENSEKEGWGIFLGPVVVFVALTALWINETRFDYHLAAKNTQAITSLSEPVSGQLISFTGDMDQDLTLQGDYIESFTGYLMIQRYAEIYAWDKGEDDEGHTTWDLRWMGSVESNSRNKSGGIRQQLSSKRLVPPKYSMGELFVDSDMIEFVDDKHDLPLSMEKVTHPRLRKENMYLYWQKLSSKGFGDERVSYSVVLVPDTATYFGKIESNLGVADTTHQRSGFVHELINDTGILHHLVGGDRIEALGAMKAHIRYLRWIVRGIATLLVIGGLLMTLDLILGGLFHIPYIGWIAARGSLVLAFSIGLPLAGLTIISGYLYTHPLTLISTIVALLLGGWLVRRHGKAMQTVLKNSLDDQYGHSLNANEMKELEFMGLVHLALSDSSTDPKELKFLRKWARKHRWGDAKFEKMLKNAESLRGTPAVEISNKQHLINLIRIALADGRMTHYEIRSIRRVARKLGYGESTVREMINRVRASVSKKAARV